MNANVNRKQVVTHEELAQAIVAFQAEGGLVVQLPPQKVVPSRTVGRRWSRYEEILISDGGAPDDRRG